ncbi:RHS repeat-associated core domain-containing protein [Nocardia sp. NPDC059177]|uniref:RHS repeat-associated core domain-containing protein n=1 Tax=Nocardia sp. NPDC059177 TaxID=3346759 RepID=UPI0036870334
MVDHAGVTFIAEDGMLLSYPHTTPGTPVVPRHGDHPWPLTLTDHGYRIHDPEREITWHFAALDPESEALGDYPIAGISDRHDNWIRHHYHPNRHPSHLTSSGGYQVTFTTADNRITTITVDGTDEHGEPVSTPLREFTYQSGDPVAVTNGVGATTHYTYDHAHRMLTWRDPDNTHFANTYDEQGRIVRQEGTDGILNATVSYETLPNNWGTRTHVTNSVGASWTYEFDTQKRLLVETDPYGAATRTDYADPVNRQPHRIIAPDLATTVYYRNADDNLVRIQRPDGHFITIDYHSRNRPSAITNADGTVTRYEYDEAGNVAAITDPDGVVVQQTYHANGAVASKTEAGGVTTFEVDAAGETIRLTDSHGAATTVTRDHFGRLISVTDPYGQTTRYTWSSEGKPLTRIDPDGHEESWTWNELGKLAAHSDRAANTQCYTYGPFGLVNSRTVADGSTTRYTWDTEERLVSVANPAGQSWTYAYDKVGRVASETDYNDATTTYRYERTGRIATVTSASGISRHHTYDNLGQVTAVRAESGEYLTYAYSPAGQLTTAISSDEVGKHTLRFTHTPAGRLLAQQVDDRLPTVLTYDCHGRTVARTNPSGNTTEWSYHLGSRIGTIETGGHQIELGYDHNGRNTSWWVGDLAHHEYYNTVGHLTARTLSTSTAAGLRNDEYCWRADGYVTGHTTATTTNGSLSRTYDLDPLGRVTSLINSDGTQQNFTYDPLSNITNSTTGPSTVIEPCLPATEPDLTSSAKFKCAPPLGESPVVEPSREYRRNLLVHKGRSRYHYDADGRLVRKTTTRISRKPDNVHYRYNAFGQLTDVYTADGKWWRYTYDAHGRRTTKRLLSHDRVVLERYDYTWDVTNLIEQVSAVETISWEYLAGKPTPLAQNVHNSDQADGNLQVIITDLVGAPTDLADPNSGMLTATAGTDLWGKTTWSGTVSTPLRFPGQQYDAETGLHYNYYRYYDPETGRYLTQDPLGLAPAPNPNTYPHNPVTWADPLGLSCSDASDGSDGHMVGQDGARIISSTVWQHGRFRPCLTS